MDLKEAESLAMSLMAEHGLSQPAWSFCFNDRRREHGQCVEYADGSGRIELSQHFVLCNAEPAVRDTILHEIAHALVGPAQGHNRAWKEMCVRVGAKPHRTSHKAAPDGRWQAVCPGCGFKHTRVRRPASGVYYCIKCGREKGVLAFAAAWLCH